MSRKPSARRLFALIVSAIGLLAGDRSFAEPFPGCGCGVVTTISQDLAERDVAVLCRLVSAPAEVAAGIVPVFEVVEVLKGGDVLARLGGAKSPQRFMASIVGNRTATRYLTFAYAGEDLTWRTVEPVNDREVDYIRRLTKLPAQGVDRLVALLRDLTSDDPLIALDVHREMRLFTDEDFRKARERLPAAKLRAGIVDPKSSPLARFNYLRMLSVCGTKDDMPMLRTLIESEEESSRKVLPWSIECYLSLGGEGALSFINDTFFKSGDRDVQEMYAAITAIRAISDKGGEISRARIVESFRLVLDRPMVADLIVIDLMRLEDWDSTPRLAQLFRRAKDEGGAAWIRLPIINFLRSSPRPEAKELLAEFRKLDPEVVEKSEAYFPTPDTR